ncbi:MAG TPA: efflux RND transporter periplasmic adaptor subunit [Gemmatimonadaceae bacterium]|nr:efflux RND transporter periplasmic adaptor subunit [Gemmatimonadaceae bacterium]
MTLKRILIILVLAVAGSLAYVKFYRGHSTAGDFTASGTVEATEAALGFQGPGRIQKIGPREGDQVKAGDELASLDRDELEARRTQAQWQLAAAKATLSDLEAGSQAEERASAREALKAATEKLADAQREFDRTQRLYQGGAVAQEVYDRAKLALDVATSQRNQAQHTVDLTEKGPRPDRVTVQRAMIAQAEAALQQADAALKNATIKAPFAGVVAVRDREPGETVAAGAPVLTIVDLNDRWIRIYIRENQIGAVRLGQAATITSDTYPAKTYSGEVSFIASQAEFTPRNVQTAEERVKLVYAVKVRITGDGSIDLKPGMPADVKLASHPN